MQAVVLYGRAVARVVLAGLYNEVTPWPSNATSHCSASGITSSHFSSPELHLITASSGYSKSNPPRHLTKKWSFGDDACFVAGHTLADVIGRTRLGIGGTAERGRPLPLLASRDCRVGTS